MKYSLALTILIFLFFLGTKSAFSQSFSNDEYTLEINPTQTPQSKKSISNDIKEFTNIPKISEKEITGDGYQGEVFPKNISPFGFNLSSDTLDFGEIESGEPITRSFQISVFKGYTPSYTISSIENHLLLNRDQVQIPNTSCDSGTCTASTSDAWNLPLTYGLGFTCKNNIGDACKDSLFKNKYLRFASNSLNETPTIFAQENKDATITIEVKLNIARTQPTSSYQNTINYIISPNF